MALHGVRCVCASHVSPRRTLRFDASRSRSFRMFLIISRKIQHFERVMSKIIYQSIFLNNIHIQCSYVKIKKIYICEILSHFYKIYLQLH